MTKIPRFIPAPEIERRSDEELIKGALEFFQMTQRRRTIRDFSDRAVPRAVIEHCIRAAGTAPSGANLQPWHFVAVSDPRVKHEIRVAAEAEEKEFYEHRAPKAWLDARSPTYYPLESVGIATGLLVTALHSSVSRR